MVSQAEQAVAGVKDAELRRVAFERILDDLLSGPNSATQQEPKSAKKSRTKKPAAGRARGGASKQAIRSGPQVYVEELVSDGYFKKQRTISDVKTELGNRGHHIAMPSLSGPLQTLCQKKTLRRQKTDGTGGKKIFGYSNW